MAHDHREVTLTRRGKEPKYASFGVPPPEVLEEALCDSSTGYLFDHTIGEYEQPPSREHRHAQARNICNGTGGAQPCPARQGCLSWALENGQRGVYGGRSVSTRTINRFKKQHELTRYLPILVKESA